MRRMPLPYLAYLVCCLVGTAACSGYLTIHIEDPATKGRYMIGSFPQDTTIAHVQSAALKALEEQNPNGVISSPGQIVLKHGEKVLKPSETLSGCGIKGNTVLELACPKRLCAVRVRLGTPRGYLWPLRLDWFFPRIKHAYGHYVLVDALMTPQGLVDLVEQQWLGPRRSTWKAEVLSVRDLERRDPFDYKLDLTTGDYGKSFASLLKAKQKNWLCGRDISAVQKSGIGWIAEKDSNKIHWVLNKLSPDAPDPKKQVEDDKEGGCLTLSSKVSICLLAALVGIALVSWGYGVYQKRVAAKKHGRRKSARSLQLSGSSDA